MMEPHPQITKIDNPPTPPLAKGRACLLVGKGRFEIIFQITRRACHYVPELAFWKIDKRSQKY